MRGYPISQPQLGMVTIITPTITPNNMLPFHEVYHKKLQLPNVLTVPWCPSTTKLSRYIRPGALPQQHVEKNAVHNYPTRIHNQLSGFCLKFTRTKSSNNFGTSDLSSFSRQKTLFGGYSAPHFQQNWITLRTGKCMFIPHPKGVSMYFIDFYPSETFPSGRVLKWGITWYNPPVLTWGIAWYSPPVFKWGITWYNPPVLKWVVGYSTG